MERRDKLMASNPTATQCRVREAPIVVQKKKSWLDNFGPSGCISPCSAGIPEAEGMSQDVVGFCFGASDEDLLACEVTLKEPGGILTACMLSALAELNYGGFTYEDLLQEMENKRTQLMTKGFVPTLEQKFILNHTTEADPANTEFLMPIGKGLSTSTGGPVKPVRKKKASDYCGLLCQKIGQQR